MVDTVTITESTTRPRFVWVVTPYAHEGWPCYAAMTHAGALDYIVKQRQGRYAIAVWHLDHAGGVPADITAGGAVYDAATMEQVATEEDRKS